MPFLATLPLAFLFAAALGALLEPTLYRRLYARPPLDQVLFSIGLVFMAVAAIDYFFGATQQFVRLPACLQGRFEIAASASALPPVHHRGLRRDHAALQSAVAKTRFGSRLRAAVDDRRVAGGLGIDVNVVFLATFAFGSGLAGLGGALGAELLGLDPTFPLKYMIYFLVVVAVGGTTTITGPLLASLMLGVADVAASTTCRSWARSSSIADDRDPDRAAARPVRTPGRPLMAEAEPGPRALPRRPLADATRRCLGARRTRAVRVPAPGRAVERDRDPRALRRLARPDPGLRRHHLARACSVLRHRMLRRGAIREARHGRSSRGLALALLAAGALGLVTSVLVLRGTDLTRLMVTLAVASILYELANRFEGITGGADGLQGVVMGPLLGQFSFDLDGKTAFVYSLVVLFVLFLVARQVVHSPFGYSLKAIRDNRTRAARSAST